MKSVVAALALTVAAGIVAIVLVVTRPMPQADIAGANDIAQMVITQWPHPAQASCQSKLISLSPARMGRCYSNMVHTYPTH